LISEKRGKDTGVAKDLSGKTLEEVAFYMASAGKENTIPYVQGLAEFTRRQTQAQIDAAEYTKRNARYMLWSVIAVAVSSVITAAVTVGVAMFRP
jgi:hypothetical protein